MPIRGQTIGRVLWRFGPGKRWYGYIDWGCSRAVSPFGKERV
jgi:hypothetical protein